MKYLKKQNASWSQSSYINKENKSESVFLLQTLSD